MEIAQKDKKNPQNFHKFSFVLLSNFQKYFEKKIPQNFVQVWKKFFFRSKSKVSKWGPKGIFFFKSAQINKKMILAKFWGKKVFSPEIKSSQGEEF